MKSQLLELNEFDTNYGLLTLALDYSVEDLCLAQPLVLSTDT